MITSAANPKVKKIVQLNKKAGQRKKEGVFITEGIKMFLEAPESRLEEIYVSRRCRTGPHILSDQIIPYMDKALLTSY